MATALASTGLGVGLVLVSPSAETLVGQFGWRGAFRVLGVGLALVLFVAATLMADDPDDVDAPTTPEFPDGRPSMATTWRDQVGVMRDALHTPAFVVLFCGYVLLYGTLYVLLNHVVNFAAGLGIRETGVLALTVIGGSTTLTRLAVGAVADRLGRIAVFVVCAAGMALALLALPLGRSPAALLVLAALFGVCYGGTGALMSAVPADLFGDRNLNTLFGLVSLSFAVPGLLGPFLAGVGFDRLGTYTPIFLVTGLVGLVGVGLVATAAWMRREDGTAG
jgi:predicted MFS family arabinose efflux permease